MIPDIKELNFPKKDGKRYATLSHAEVNIADMGEKTITTQVKIDGEITPDFSQDWEVEFQGEKFIMPLREPQGAKENTSLNSTIVLTFQHWAIYQLKRWPFVTMQPIDTGTAIADEEVAPVQLNLGNFCDLFGRVLKYYYGDTITIDFNDYKKHPDTGWQYKEEPTTVEINHSYIWDVLIKFYELFAVRWEIVAASTNSNTVKGGERYVIRVGYPTTEVDHIFEYGFEGGLLKVERQVQSEEIRNMIKGRGGEKNLPRYYFKQVPENEKDKWFQDPDWVEELAAIPFSNLYGATFRSYIQGWKAAHISKYPGYKAVGEANAYSPWAYRKGYADSKFHPVEFVADEITLTPEAGDKQVEILPGFTPYAKKDSSIAKYGPLQQTLDNNEEICPTLQGTGLDIAVAVEEIQSDDVEATSESEAEQYNLGGLKKTQSVATGATEIIKMQSSVTFTIDEGRNGIIEIVNPSFSAWYKYPFASTSAPYRPVPDSGYEVIDNSIAIIDVATGEELLPVGIPPGTYRYEARFKIRNKFGTAIRMTASCAGFYLRIDTPSKGWNNTFDIWVKNIWDSAKKPGETDLQYSERVWGPILGDREGNTAKVVFTTGMLAHEDYEFTIVDYPSPDTSREWNDADGVTHTSHWRVTLAKSDAELEATGLYVPSTQKQGAAGDKFVLLGVEMTHDPYVIDAERRLDNWKKDHLREVGEIAPTWVVTTDRVRLNNEGRPDSLINQLRAGSTIRLADSRFITTINDQGETVASSPISLYLQSLKYTYREPSSDDAALNPDLEIILSNDYTTSANPVSVMQSEVTALQRQVGSISNVEQIIRAVGDKLYLRKDGISDRSLSPTEFASLIGSLGFRAGIIGGEGWGAFKDENGNWVFETDRINVRQGLQVNTIVVNQAEGRGGMQIDTAAYIEKVTRVTETADGYICYFDQKEGSVANLFHVDDIAYCSRWDADNSLLKFYKRRVVELGVDYIKLAKALTEAERPAAWPDSGVNGEGIPGAGDAIIHYGNYRDKERQYVKVRDVVGGGYERYLEGLDSVNSDGVEYYFVGRQSGVNGGRPRFFLGGEKAYIKWEEDGLAVKGKISTESTLDDSEETLKDALAAGGGPVATRNIALESGGWERIATGSYAKFADAGLFAWDRWMRMGALSFDAGRMSVERTSKRSEGFCEKLSVNTLDKGMHVCIRVKGSVSGLADIADRVNILLADITAEDGAKHHFATISANGDFEITAEGEIETEIANPYMRFDYADANVGTKVTLDHTEVYIGERIPSMWTAAPEDIQYLEAALRKARADSSVFDGGLMLSTLLLLGMTDVDGVRRIYSGLSGINRQSAGSDIALWLGGDPLTAQPDPTQAPRAQLLHNGTGYFANKVISFTKDALEILDPEKLIQNDQTKVRLDKTGLHLINSAGEEILQVANVEISATAAAGTTHTSQTSASAQLVYRESAVHKFTPCGPWDMTARFASNNSPVIESDNATLTATISLHITADGSWNIPLGTRPYFEWEFIVGYADGSEDMMTASGVYKEIVSGGSTYDYTFRLTPDKGKIVTFVSIANSNGVSDAAGGAIKGATVRMTAKVAITYGLHNRTTIGNNGIMTAQGGAKLLCLRPVLGDEGETEMSFTGATGTFGLKVSESGFKYIKPGSSEWKAWDPAK